MAPTKIISAKISNLLSRQDRPCLLVDSISTPDVPHGQYARGREKVTAKERESCAEIRGCKPLPNRRLNSRLSATRNFGHGRGISTSGLPVIREESHPTRWEHR